MNNIKIFEINLENKTIEFDLHGHKRNYNLTKSSMNRLADFIEKNNLLVFGNDKSLICDLWLSGYYPKRKLS